MDTQRSARTTILKERVKQLPNLPRGAFKDMLDQVVTTFSVSILTKEKGMHWPCANMTNGSNIATTKKQSFRNCSRDKSPHLTKMLRGGVTRSERGFIS